MRAGWSAQAGRKLRPAPLVTHPASEIPCRGGLAMADYRTAWALTEPGDHRNRLVKVEHRAGHAAVDRVIENYYDSENRWLRRAIDARVPLLRQKQCGNQRMALLAFRQAVAHGARQFAGHAGGAPAAAAASPRRKPGVDSDSTTPQRLWLRGNRVLRLAPGAHAPGSELALAVARNTPRLIGDTLGVCLPCISRYGARIAKAVRAAALRQYRGNWKRRRPDSNRGMADLQSAQLPEDPARRGRKYAGISALESTCSDEDPITPKMRCLPGCSEKSSNSFMV